MKDSSGPSPPDASNSSESDSSLITNSEQETGATPDSPDNTGDPPTQPPPENGDDDWETPEEGELGGKMTFLEHLDELRKRIVRSAIAVGVSFCCCWFFREPIFEFLAKPIYGAVDKLVFIKPTEPFTIYLKASFVAGIFLAIPVILFQVWIFIAPGLYRKERRYVIPFLTSSTLLFLLGGTFAYYVILPTALTFLITDFGKAFQPMVSAIEYFNFEMIIILGMGSIFQLPVIVAFLSMFGLITPAFLWKNFKFAFLIMVIIAAIVSPTTDVINLFLWSGPMVLLYLLSVAISWVFKRKAEKRNQI